MGRHRHSSGSEAVRKEYGLLDTDATNPVMQRILVGRDPTCLYHKDGGRVVQGPFKRKHIFSGHTVQEVLQKLFVSSDFLSDNLTKEGFEAFDSAGTHFKLQTQEERLAFAAATLAKPVGEYKWHRRYGMGKDFAPRFAPISWWAYISEDQYIEYKPESDEAQILYDIVSLELGEHLRTVRLWDIKNIAPYSVEVTMQYGAINTRSGQLDKEACGIREQAFRETEDPNWKWAARAEEIINR